MGTEDESVNWGWFSKCQMSQKWHNRPSVCRIVELSGSLLNRHCGHGISAEFLRLEGSRKSYSINTMVATKYLKCRYNDTFASIALCPSFICKVCSPRVSAPWGGCLPTPPCMTIVKVSFKTQKKLSTKRSHLSFSETHTLFHVTKSIATPEGLDFTEIFLHAFDKSVTRVQHVLRIVPRVNEHSRVLWKQENGLLQQSGILVSQKQALTPQEKPHGTPRWPTTSKHPGVNELTKDTSRWAEEKQRCLASVRRSLRLWLCPQ